MCELKRISLFCLSITLLLGVVSHAQSTKRISVKVDECRLDILIDTISALTNVGFIYESKILKNLKKVSVWAVNVTINDLLDNVLSKQGLQYKLKDNICYIIAKEISVNGKVMDEKGNPLVSAIVEVNHTHWFASDNKGAFSVNNISYGDTLSFVHMGYQPKNVIIKDDSALAVTLDLQIPSMPLVKVISGYNNNNLKTWNTVSLKSIQQYRMLSSDVIKIIQENISGVFAPPTSGLTGSTHRLQIRGQTSIGLISGSLPINDPLIIIDGIPYAANYTSLQPVSRLNIMGAPGKNPYLNININDIESISVLKNADETAIYGSNAANGVIVINTMSGNIKPPSLSIKVAMGLGRAMNLPDMMNTQQYLSMRREAFRNDNEKPTELTAPDLVFWDSCRYTDFRKNLLNTISREVDLHTAVSGGSNSTQYYFSGGYKNETAPLPRNVNLGRGSLDYHITQKIAKEKLQIDVFNQFASSKSKAGVYDLAGYGYLPPNMPQIGNEEYNINTSSFHAGVELKYRPLAALLFSLKLGYNSIVDRESVSLPVRWQTTFSMNASLTNDYQINRNYFSRYVEPQLQYNFNHKGLKYTFLLGAAIQKMGNRVNNSIEVPSFNDPVSNNAIVTNTTENNERNYISCYSRADLQIKNKYLANITFRRDGSDLLRANDRFGNFGAIGAGWVFLYDSINSRSLRIINYGKLKGSYGVTGNDQFVADNYSYNKVYPSANFLGTAATVPLLVTKNSYNWEITRKIDLGVELGLFNNNITLDLAVFRSRTGNQIVGYPDPERGLNSYKVINIPAVVQNTGLEMALRLRKSNWGRFCWNSIFIITLPNNKLLSYPGLSTSPYANMLVTGRSLTVQQGYKFKGVNSTSGLFEMEDLNKDGRVDRYNDFKILGNLDPKLYGSMRFNLCFENWYMNIFLEGSVQKGISMLSQIYTNLVPGADMVNLPVEFLDRWRKTGDQSRIQRLATNNNVEARSAIDKYVESDARLVSASYLRLKYINLSHNIHIYRKWVEILGQLSLFLVAENLFTITKYKKSDPGFQNIFTQPLQTSFTIGVRLSF